MANLEPKTSPIVAALAAFCCLGGLGHFLLGQGGKGTYIIGLFIGTTILSPCTGGLLGLVTLVIWVLAIMDAHAVATAVEAGEEIDENEYKNEFLFKVMSNLHKDAIFNG